MSTSLEAASAATEQALRVVVVGPVPPPAGGMAVQTRQLVELWLREGVDTTIVPVNPPYRPAWVGSVPRLRALWRLPVYVIALWRAAGRTDCFHVMANSGWSWFLFALPALLVARLRRVPVVVNYRGGRAAEFMKRYCALVRPTMRLADMVVVPSGFLQQLFEKYGLQSQVIPNVVDVERFPWREPAASTPTAPHVVITRNLEPIYDISTALHAFARLRYRFPRARLTVAGSGSEREALVRLANELEMGESSQFVGHLDREQIAELYASADVMLNTSVVDNMPNALLEALACGVPTVTTAAGGIRWVVTDGETALLVPERDPGAAARAVERVLEDRVLARMLARCGREAAANYTWPTIRRQWLATYEHIRKGRG